MIIRCVVRLSLFGALAVSQVLAGTLNDDPDSSSRPLGTILITPDWQKLEVTPGERAGVTAYTAQQLDAAGVDNTQQLQFTIPGLVFKSSAGGGDPYLRGVGGTASVAGDSGIVTLVDGVYMASPVQSLQEFYDVERVDVIKGPGSRLSALGGAISVASKDPVFFREAYADALYGTADRRLLRSAVNLPLSDAGLAFRLAGLLERRGGYSRNVFRNEDLDDRDYYALRGKLRYRPTSNLNLVLAAEKHKQDDTRDLAKYPNPAIGVNGGVLLGGIVPADPREVTPNADQNQAADHTLYSARLNWRQAHLELQSITAWQKVVKHDALDLDSTNIDYSSSFPASSTRAISQQFRVGSRGERDIGWTGGLYLRQEDIWQKQDVRFPLASVENRVDNSARRHAYALSGELTWRFAPKWQGRAGLRYSYDDAVQDMQQIIADPYGVLGMPGTRAIKVNQDDHWEGVSPTLGLSYAPNANSRLYAEVSRGYKPGGYNALGIQPAFDPESLLAYQAGVETAWPQQNLNISSTLFYYDYRDIQLLTLPPDAPAGTLPVIDNAPRARVQGLEIQAGYRPFRRLELSVGATLMKARYREFVSVDPNNPATDPDHAGGRMQQAPDVSVVLRGRYGWVLPEHGIMTLSADFRYQSAVYFNPYQDRAVRQGGYSLLNARLGLQSRTGRWYAELYGNNLTDKLYARNIIRIDPVVGTVRYWGEPRSFGLRMGYRL